MSNLIGNIGKLQDWITNSKFWSTKLVMAGGIGGVFAEQAITYPVNCDRDAFVKVGFAFAAMGCVAVYNIANAYQKKATATVETKSSTPAA